MVYLAKMAYLQLATNMANIRQSLNKICNEMAKRPFESCDFDENGDVDQIARNPQRLPCKSNEEAKGPLKSGEYDENGEKSQRRF